MENEDRKKMWLIIGGILFFVIIVGIIIFYFVSTDKTQENNSSGGLVAVGDMNTNDPPNTPTGGVFGGDTEKKKLFLHLTDKPVIGVTLIKTGETYRVRYVDQETGHIYEMGAEGDESPTLLSNKTIPRVQEGYWGNSNNTIVLRYIETNRSSGRDIIRTYIGSLVNTVDGGTIEGKFLPDNISTFSVSPNGSYGFYLIPNEIGVVGFVVNMKTLESTPEFNHAFREWLPQLLDNSLFLTTKASAEVLGFSYSTKIDGKNFLKKVGNKKGLTAKISWDAKRVVWSEIANKSLLTGVSGGVVTGDEGFYSLDYVFPFAALAEKCVWSKDNIIIYCAGTSQAQKVWELPDLWYMGDIFFEDQVWIADTDTGESDILGDPTNEGVGGLDMIDPILAPDASHFYMRNKKDGTLWTMRIENGIRTNERVDVVGEDI